MGWFKKKTKIPPKVINDESIVNDYINERDYLHLASFVTSGKDYYAREKARKALIAAGADAVPAIALEMESARHAWRGGVTDLALALLSIGDPKGVPVLKSLLDDGSFDATAGLSGDVKKFIGQYPDLQPPTPTATCLLCQNSFPLNETELYGDSLGREWRLCKSCWPKRSEWLSKISKEERFLRPYAYRTGGWSGLAK